MKQRGPTCYRCRSILDYVYHTWWKCRGCGRWHDIFRESRLERADRV